MKKIVDPSDAYLLSPKALHLEMPLYTEIDLSLGSVAEKVYECISYEGTIDAYCINCKKESVFNTSSRIYETPYGTETNLSAWMSRGDGFKRVAHKCTRCNTYYYAYYSKDGSSFVKFGQLPSAADFQIPQAEKYRKILGEQQYKELTKGIGLSAHGVGIGSFVYLRRIFENLIEEAHKTASANGAFDDGVYRMAKMDEKIQILSDLLPEFLVENRTLYSIMSKGIHELTEEECLRYFESVRIGIEQILDEKIEKAEKTAKADKARKAIQGLSQVVSSKTNG